MPGAEQCTANKPPSLQRKGAANAVSGGCPGRRGATADHHIAGTPINNPLSLDGRGLG